MMTLNRREFCAGVAMVTIAVRTRSAWAAAGSAGYQIVAQTDRSRVLQAAKQYFPMEPVTITAFQSPKSPGGPHDFFSQADYFWPNPKNPDGPYINRDGQSNPENFNDHRRVMIDLSVRMPALTAAWLLTKDRRYAKRSGDHLRAWFVTPETRMNPNLEFSQGVHGASTGRNYGIIDTLHLVEVARAASFLGAEALSAADQQSVKQWFREYLSWMKDSEKGKQERATLNNHATCWALQASEFARLAGDEGTRDEIRLWFTGKLLPDQLGMDGSFPKELVRTKPYSYSIFNFDVMAGLAQSLKGSGADLTIFTLPDGRGLCKAAEFLYPFLKDKEKWPYAKDVEHFDALPVRSPGLLFSGLGCNRTEYIALWKTLNPDPTDKEIIRNYPIRQPLLWV
ncbi:alginate lyase family protein [Tunturiibacter lichenicola]|uniref:alginate lyase family protein n=1 Tax=Tunturiibacter lichenicola TaxID=2051959 RepID=UPI003D9B5A92